MKEYFSLNKIYEWRYYLSIFTIVAIVASTRLIGLTLIPSGFADLEIANFAAAQTFNALNTPLEAIYFTLLRATHELGFLGPFVMRGVTALMGIAVIGMAYVVMKQWFSSKIAIYATMLSSVASVLLFASRVASPEIILLLWVLLFIYLMGHSLRNDKLIHYLLAGMIFGLGLYTPFFIYFSLPIFAVYMTLDQLESGRFNRNWLIVIGTGLALGAPLIYALVTNQVSFTEYFQINHLVLSYDAALNWIQLIFAGSTEVGIFNAQYAPYIDIATAIFSLFGLVWVIRYKRDEFLWLSASVLVISAFIGIIFTGTDSVSFLFSLWIIFLAAIGIDRFLERWNSVFPRNPVARKVALLPAVILIGFISLFHLNSYFIAFPQTPDSVNVYHEIAPQIVEYVDGNELSDVVVIAEPDTVSRIQLLSTESILSITPPVELKNLDAETIIVSSDVSGFNEGEEFELKAEIISETRELLLFRVFNK